MTKTLPQEGKVKAAFENYIGTLEKTQERRNAWNTETKAKIIETLTLVKDTFKFDWQVQRLEETENYQTINISCNKGKSGIMDIEVDRATGQRRAIKSYVKHGGYLAFCQSYNGKINVIIGYPYIDEWVSQMDSAVIGTFEPSEVTEDVITNQVIKFLEEMAKWEGKDRASIGFGSSN